MKFVLCFQELKDGDKVKPISNVVQLFSVPVQYVTKGLEMKLLFLFPRAQRR